MTYRKRICWCISACLTALALAACPPAPKKATPNNGHPDGLGEIVTLSGQYFTGTSEVTFCGAQAPWFHVDNDKKIRAEVPANLPGRCDISVTNADGTGILAVGFSYFDRTFGMGTIPNPAPGQTIIEAVETSAAASTLSPLWGGPTPWYDMRDWLNTQWIPGDPDSTMVNILRSRGVEPILILAPITGNDKIVPSHWSEEEKTLCSEIDTFRNALADAAWNIANDHKLAYMMVGNEVNTWWQSHHENPDDPDHYDCFISLYGDAYDAIKSASPDTKVFASFAYNKIAHPEPTWDPVDAFDPAALDVLVLTSYPFFQDVTGFEVPGDIPPDYYRAAKLRYENKALGFTEIAWTTGPDDYGDHSEEEQSEFLDAFFDLTGTIRKEFVCYFQLNDHENELGYKQWGLWRWQDDVGNPVPLQPKLGWATWSSLYDVHARDLPDKRMACEKEEFTDLALPIIHVDELSAPERLPYPVNTPCCEDAIEISPDGSTLYFFWSADDLPALIEQGLQFTHSMFVFSYRTEQGWLFPRLYDLTLGNDESINGETSHTDAGEIFFHSNRVDNLGYQQGLPPGQDFDIDVYMTTADGYEPTGLVHLQEPVNSVYVDGEHFVTRDGQTMYLSSNRPGSLGGVDVWVSHRTAGVWTDPENLGEPVNSTGNDYQPMVSPDGNTLYLSTNRSSPYGLDIYRFHKDGEDWIDPEIVVGPNCGEATMTDDGHLFFVHVKTKSLIPLVKQDADIWVSHPKE